MHDFQAAARRFYGPLPSGFGGSSGVASEKWTFEWQYARSDELYDTPNYIDQNLNPLRITLNYVELCTIGDTELGGNFLTITYYGSELGEGEDL